MNIKKQAKFMVYACSIASAAAVGLGIGSLVTGDIEGLTADIFLLLVSVICLRINWGIISDTPPCGPEF